MDRRKKGPIVDAGGRHPFPRKEYYFNNAWLLALVTAVDFLGGLLFAKRFAAETRPRKNDIKKILVSRPDHLGDVVMTTAALSLMKAAMPEAKIHVLAGSWTKELWQHCPLVDHVIVFDHFYLNRSKMPAWRKILRSVSQLPAVIKKIKKERYDLGIEFRPFFGNTIPLMWLGGVKYRIGYGSAGFGFLLHQKGSFNFYSHFAKNMVELLLAGDLIEAPQEIRAVLKRPKKEILDKMSRALAKSGVTADDFKVVIHPGSGRPLALWSNGQWAELADGLVSRYGAKVIIVGVAKEAMAARAISRKMATTPIDLTNSLSMADFMALLSMANLVIGLESFAVHAAAALGAATVMIHNGISDELMFKPLGQRVFGVTHKTDCAPCWRRKGCPEMSCLTNVTANEVMAVVSEVLNVSF